MCSLMPLIFIASVSSVGGAFVAAITTAVTNAGGGEPSTLITSGSASISAVLLSLYLTERKGRLNDIKELHNHYGGKIEQLRTDTDKQINAYRIETERKIQFLQSERDWAMESLYKKRKTPVRRKKAPTPA